MINEFQNRAIGYTEDKLKYYTKPDLKKIINQQLELIGGEKYSKFDINKLPDTVVKNQNKFKKYLL